MSKIFSFTRSQIRTIKVNSSSLSDNAISSSYALTSSYAINSGGGGGTTTGSFTGSFTGSLFGTASHAITASYAMNGGSGGSTQSLQQVVNTGNSIVNFGGVGTASLQSVNFVNNRALYINNDIYPTIRIVDNTNASNNLQIDIDTISLDGVSYNWSDNVNNVDTSSFATTGSNIFIGNQTISGSLYQSGTFYPDIIDWISSSIQMGTGSYILTTNNDGITQYDTYANIASALSPYISVNTSSIATTGSNTFIGNQIISGSVTISGSLNATSSNALSSSYALSASNAITASYALNVTDPFPYSGSAVISGSLLVQYDPSGGLLQGIDTNTTTLYDGNNASKVEWGSGRLKDTTNIKSVDWENRQLWSGSFPDLSVDWGARQLWDENGDGLALEWINTGTSNGVRLYGTSSYAITSSYAQNAQTASFVTTAQTASYVLQAVSSSLASTASYVITAQTASFVNTAQTASYVNPLNQNVIITGSLVVSGSGTTIELYGDKIIAGAVGGDEGGEILLGKPATSSSLTGSGITIDSYQNRLRFFEQGGSARGGFLDITTLGAGASTNLQKSSNYFYDAYLINTQTTAAGVDTTINNISLVTKANEAWSFEFVTIGQCSGTGGVRFTVVYSATPVSSSVTYWGNSTQVGNMSSATTILTTPAQSGTLWATATPIDVQATIRASFVNGANANTVTIKVQPVNGAQTATIRAMAYLTARRIS